MGALWSRHDDELPSAKGQELGKDTAETSLNSAPEALTLREFLEAQPDIIEAGPAPEPKSPEPAITPTPDPEPIPEPAHDTRMEAVASRSSSILLACCCDPNDDMADDMPDIYGNERNFTLDFSKPLVDPVTGERFVFCPQGHGARCHADCGPPIMDPDERPAYIAAYRARLRQAEAMGRI